MLVVLSSMRSVLATSAQASPAPLRVVDEANVYTGSDGTVHNISYHVSG